MPKAAGIHPQQWKDDSIRLDGQHLPITWLPWHFDGRRAYFLCNCGRRVKTLYAPHGQQWRCRSCYALTYATRQAAPDYRLILKAQKIRERLGGPLGVTDAFPAKPKGMHWRRYRRLRQLHDQAVGAGLSMLTPIFKTASLKG